MFCEEKTFFQKSFILFMLAQMLGRSVDRDAVSLIYREIYRALSIRTPVNLQSKLISLNRMESATLQREDGERPED